MWLMLFVNVVWCEVFFLVDSFEAGEAYAACLNAAGNGSERVECFFTFVEAVGTATSDFFACVN
jgi:hypothetical protein